MKNTLDITLDTPGKYNLIELITNDQNVEPDYYLIINRPKHRDSFDPSRSIVYQMEPWVSDASLTHGVSAWGEWARPNPNTFLHVNAHCFYFNVANWYFKIPRTLPTQRFDAALCVLSQKAYDIGQKHRVKFCQYASLHDRQLVHVRGRKNYHSLDNYHGPL
jgi:hypothetical protein